MKIDSTDQEILKLLTEGMTAKEISASLKITAKAVEKRIERMKKKNDCRTKSQLIKNFLTL